MGLTPVATHWADVGALANAKVATTPAAINETCDFILVLRGLSRIEIEVAGAHGKQNVCYGCTAEIMAESALARLGWLSPEISDPNDASFAGERCVLPADE